jgi:lipoate-protein ligase A
MYFCDLTFPSPEENLACDEALLEAAERGPAFELLRVWEPMVYFVVVGYANKVATEINLPFCKANDIPVLRRCTGGGTVLQGPGCINYSLILRTSDAGPFHTIPATNAFILKRHEAAFAALLHEPVELAGETDLALGELKFSGNAQRRKKQSLLFHGTLLLQLDIALVEKALLFPSKQPGYRRSRSHSDFLTNLNVPSSSVISTLAQCWNALEPLPNIPLDEISRLANEKYRKAEWNFRL